MYDSVCAGDVVLDSSVTRINYATYVASGVTSITIPSTTTFIDYQPFTWGNGITAINVDAANPNYKSVGGVLYNKSGTVIKQYPQAKTGSSFTIPSGVTEIGFMAFSCAINLNTLTIPDAVTIADNAYTPNGCNENGISAINVGSGNANYSSIDGVLFNKTATTILAYPHSKPGASYVMPTSVTSIIDQALSSSKDRQLQSITLSPNLTSIGQYSFVGLSLPTLNLPASLTTIAMLGLYNIGAITIDPANTNFIVEDNVLYNFNKTKLVYYPLSDTRKTFTVPDTVTTFESYLVGQMQRLVIGAALTSVGNYNALYSLKYLNIVGDTQADFSNLQLPYLISVNYCGSNVTTLANINARLTAWNNATRVCVTNPAFTFSSSSEVAAVNTAISGYTVTNSGGAIASYSISPDISNTPGLSFDTSTGLISGTPTSIAASQTYTITGTNAAEAATRTFAITVSADEPIDAPAFTLSSSTISATTGVAVSGYTINSTGGAIASYSISPAISNTPGLSFSTATGLISGTPTTAASAATYTITATNATSPAATRTFTITVNAPTIVYIPPTPVPFLRTVTPPKMNLKDGKLICTSGTHNIGYTVNGVVETSSIKSLSTATYTYNLEINGVTENSLTVTTAANKATWNIPTATVGSLISCSVSVSTNSLTRLEMSTDNSTGVNIERLKQTNAISEAEAIYKAVIKANSKTYSKALAENRIKWIRKIAAIRANHDVTTDRIKASGGSKMKTDATTAFNVMAAAKAKSNTDYSTSKRELLASKNAFNKITLNATTATIAKANAEYGAFIESIGYGVLTP